MFVTLICLVGEQPIPNLLPILHYRPRTVVLVHSSYTERVADRLSTVVSSQQPGIVVRKCLVEPYSVAQIYQELELAVGSLQGSELLVNLTGGTKPMMLAAFQLALTRKTPSFYFKSEGLLTEMYFLKETSLPVPATTPVAFETTLTIELHAAVFGQELKTDPASKQEAFEAAVANALKSVTPAVFDQVVVGARFGLVEIDVIVRWRNQIVFCEVNHQALDKKVQQSQPDKPVYANLKKKLDQLSTASGKDYFGTYLQKAVIFVGTEANIHPDYALLSKAQKVQTIPLPFQPSQDGSPHALAEHAKTELVQQLSKILKPSH